MNSTGIVINNLGKEFHSLKRGRIVALRNINLKIVKGEFFVILGPSGCGKSTLLNIIAGLEKPDSGEIWFDKNLICSREKKIYTTPKMRNVAMVFQSYALYPHMTVFENIAFPLSIARVAKKEIQERIKEVAEMLNIENLLRVKPGELSGGQRQRVAMARAITRHPRLFLLDEPLSNLDAKLRVKMRAELKTLQRRLGVTTIYVTHDQVEAMTLGDRMAILKDGEVQQVANPQKVYNNPINTFVAGFLGTPPMNLLSAAIIKRNNKIFVKLAEIEFALPDEMISLFENLGQKSFILGIRPEDIECLPSQMNTGFVREIKLIERLGNEVLIHIQIGAQEILIKLSQARGHKEGELARFKLNLEKVHYFDKDGKKIADKS